ncbi:MAG: hypothetical protein ACRDVN_07435 [Jiangellaceae bacterium]
MTERAASPVAVPDDAVLPARHPDAPAPGELIASHYHLCVGCGRDHPTGLRVEVTAGEGLTLSGRFTVTECRPQDVEAAVARDDVRRAARALEVNP